MTQSERERMEQEIELSERRTDLQLEEIKQRGTTRKIRRRTAALLEHMEAK